MAKHVSILLPVILAVVAVVFMIVASLTVGRLVRTPEQRQGIPFPAVHLPMR